MHMHLTRSDKQQLQNLYKGIRAHLAKLQRYELWLHGDFVGIIDEDEKVALESRRHNPYHIVKMTQEQMDNMVDPFTRVEGAPLALSKGTA